MRDRHRPALRNLLLEFRDHAARAARAAKYITKSHRLELRAWRSPLQRLTRHLGQALARAHHVSRIDGFIGGDQHEVADMMTDRRARHCGRRLQHRRTDHHNQRAARETLNKAASCNAIRTMRILS